MAHIETRKGKRKTTYRVIFKLFFDGIPKKKYKPFDNKADAVQFYPTAQAIEDKSKMSLVDPKEVSLWVERGYIDQEEAFEAFSLYAATVTAEKKGAVPIDWDAIKARYEHNAVGGSQSTDLLTTNHRKRMSLYNTVSSWVKKHHPDLQMKAIDVNDWQLEMRENKIRAMTRKHRFYCLRKIYKAAIELEMVICDPTELAEKPRTPAIKRGSYKSRAIFEASQLPELLKSVDSMKGASWTQPRPQRSTKKILNVSPEVFDGLPEFLTRSQVMDLLQISNATIIRYTKGGFLPNPDRVGAKRNGAWRMNTESLKTHLFDAQKDLPEQMMLFTRKEEHSMMRGCFPLALRCGLFAGLRNGECNWLPWHHVDLKAEELFIGPVESPLGIVWSPKTEVDEEEEGTEERTLGMSKELLRYFKYEKTRQEKLGINTFFVFPSGHTMREVNHGKPLSESVLNQCFNKFIKHAGLTPSVRGKKYTFYSLRHTFCTMMLRQGVEIGTVSERMGHSDIRTTQSYIHPREAGAKVERVMDHLLIPKSDEDL